MYEYFDIESSSDGTYVGLPAHNINKMNNMAAMSPPSNCNHQGEAGASDWIEGSYTVVTVVIVLEMRAGVRCMG